MALNPTCRWVTIAAAFRFFGGYAIGFYNQGYFNGVYDQYLDEFAYANAFVVSACGFVSALSGGLIATKYE